MSVNRSCGFRRREFLLAGLATVLSVSACTTAPAQDGSLDATKVLRPVLKTARRLADAHAAAAKARPELKDSLEMLRDNHTEHVKILQKLIGESAKAEEPDGDGSLESLRDAESDAAKQAAKACAGAPPDYAVLLGEIAACRTTHHDLLKVL